MKKTKFLLLWIICAPVAIAMGMAVIHLAQYAFRSKSLSALEATELTERLRVAKHPNAELCMMHYPKVGAFAITFAGQVNCEFVRSRLDTENSKMAQSAMQRMTFVHDMKTPGICYAAGDHVLPIAVNCKSVEHLLEAERYCRLVD